MTVETEEQRIFFTINPGTGLYQLENPVDTNFSEELPEASSVNLIETELPATSGVSSRPLTPCPTAPASAPTTPHLGIASEGKGGNEVIYYICFNLIIKTWLNFIVLFRFIPKGGPKIFGSNIYHTEGHS